MNYVVCLYMYIMYIKGGIGWWYWHELSNRIFQLYDVVENQPVNSSVNLLYADDYYEVRLKLKFASIGLSFFGVKEETLDLLEKDKEAICISVYNCVYIIYIYTFTYTQILLYFTFSAFGDGDDRTNWICGCYEVYFLFELLDVFSVGLLESSALEI